jgi:hypothetical protein
MARINSACLRLFACLFSDVGGGGYGVVLLR